MTVGAVDWIARYQTVRDGIEYVAGHKAVLAVSYPWLSPLILAIGLIIIFIGKRPSVSSSEERPPSSQISDSFKQTQTLQDVGNPRIEMHTHMSAPTVYPEPEPWPEPNLRCMPPTQEWIHSNGDGFAHSQMMNEGKLFCGIVKFANEPTKPRIGNAHHVKALIIFLNRQKVEIGRASPATWVGCQYNLIDIPAAETRELVLYILRGEAPEIIAVKNPRLPRTKYDRSPWYSLEVKPINDPESLAFINIHLVSGDKNIGSFVVPCAMVAKSMIFGAPEKIQAAS